MCAGVRDTYCSRMLKIRWLKQNQTTRQEVILMMMVME